MQTRYQPYQGSWNWSQETNRYALTAQDFDVLAWHSFGMRNRSRKVGKSAGLGSGNPKGFKGKQ